MKQDSSVQKHAKSNRGILISTFLVAVCEFRIWRITVSTVHSWPGWNYKAPQVNNKSKIVWLTPTFQQSPVNIFILWFGQGGVFVEQIGHKSEVEFGVSTDDVSWGDKLSTAEPVGLLQHGLRPLHVVSLLSNTQSTHTEQLSPRCEDTQSCMRTVTVLTLKPAMLMSIRSWSSSVPFGEIWLRRWK